MDDIIHLLYCDVQVLDSGYALLLRQEAWDAGESLTEALQYLVSSQVQEEIDTIAVSIETSTMDVERKHNLDKRSEKCTVNSAAKASRDSFIRARRQTLASQGAAAPAAKLRKKLRKRKRECDFLNVASMACQWHPNSFLMGAAAPAARR